VLFLWTIAITPELLLEDSLPLDLSLDGDCSVLLDDLLFELLLTSSPNGW